VPLLKIKGGLVIRKSLYFVNDWGGISKRCWAHTYCSPEVGIAGLNSMITTT